MVIEIFVTQSQAIQPQLPMVTPHPEEVHQPHLQVVGTLRQAPISGNKGKLGAVVVAVAYKSANEIKPHVIADSGMQPAAFVGTQPPHDATLYLSPHVDQQPVPVETHPSHGTGEVTEAGLQNHRVAVYRSGDVRETAYKQVIPMDRGAPISPLPGFGGRPIAITGI